jgi:hypothetical protein
MWPCGQCGFNLTAHPQVGRCPQCKADVAEMNLYRNRFRHVDRLINECRVLAGRHVFRVVIILACAGLVLLNRWLAVLVLPVNLIRAFGALHTSWGDYANARRQVHGDSVEMLAAFDSDDDPTVRTLAHWVRINSFLAWVHHVLLTALVGLIVWLFV